MSNKQFKRPTGFRAELNFYFIEPQSPRDQIAHFVRGLVNLGGTFVGQALIIRGDSIEKPTGIVIDPLGNCTIDQVYINSMSELEPIFSSNDKLPILIDMQNVVCLPDSQFIEVVTFVEIPAQVLERDHHPLVVYVEGDRLNETVHPYFGESARQAKARRKIAKTIGNQIYRRFIAIANETRPAYGAITIEQPLECPTELAQRLGSSSFIDFYVDESYVGKSNLQKIKKIFSGAYIEKLDHGTYFSAWFPFNPKGITLESLESNFPRSIQVAKIIGSLSYRQNLK